MDINTFSEFYLNPLLEKVSAENKKVFLLGDFNIDLLSYDSNSQISEIVDTWASNCFLPLITQPTRFGFNSQTLIDNIFSNEINSITTSGNLTIHISDHLPQFSIVNNIFSSEPKSKHIKYERDWKNFDEAKFSDDFNSLDWDTVLDLNSLNSNKSMELLLIKINLAYTRKSKI